jgi:hypothetical protein
MTLDEAIKHCENVAAKCFVERSARNHSGKCGFEHLELAAWLRELKAYKEQEPYVDAISREAAIRWVKTECNPYGKPTIDFESGKKVIEHLKKMPSVTPKQKTGKWNVLGYDDPSVRMYKCSECHMKITLKFNYCPNCGAKMEGGKK